MWICPKCHASVEPSFEVCWACGTTVDGIEDPTFVTADEAVAIADPTLDVRSKREPGLDLDDEWPEAPNELVECYRPRDSTEAKFLIDRLAEHGIMAVANGTRMGDTEYLIPVFSPRIEVRSGDHQRARGLVAEYESRRKARRAGAEGSDPSY